MLLGEMVAVTRDYLDDPQGRRHKRPNVVRYLNAGQDDLKRVIEQADEGFFSTCVELSVVSGDNDYEFDLPADFSKLLQLERLTDGSPNPAEPVRFQRRHPIRDDRFLPAGFATAPTYYLRGNKIGIVKPDTSYTLRMFYSQNLDRLDQDSDETVIPRDYHDLICLMAAKRGFGAEQRQMPPDLNQLRQEQVVQLTGYIEDRQRQTPEYVDILEP